MRSLVALFVLVLGSGCRAELPAAEATASGPATSPPSLPPESGPAAASSPSLLPGIAAVGSASASGAPALVPKLVYFPPGTLSDSRLEWYSKYLSAMEEGPLLDMTKPGEQSYRFLWLHSFFGRAAVRVVHRQEETELFAVRLNGVGNNPGGVAISQRFPLTKEDWSEIQRELVKAHYDTMAPFGTSMEELTGSDGVTWVMESVRDGKYRLVERWAPDYTGREPGFRLLCEKFIKLAGPAIVKRSRH